MSPVLPPKKEVALALLERASVFVHLDPRPKDVRVPPWLKKQPQLVLQVGLNMAVKIPDLEVNDEAVCCTLSFSRSPHFCYVPWSAIYALVGEDGRGMVWPEDIPPEVASAAAEGAKSGRGAKKTPEQPARISVVPSAPAQVSAPQATAKPRAKRKAPSRPLADTANAEPEVNTSAKLRPSERPYLRLVRK